MDLRLHPCSVDPAEDHEKCGPNRPSSRGFSCNNATFGACRTRDPKITRPRAPRIAISNYYPLAPLKDIFNYGLVGETIACNGFL